MSDPNSTTREQRRWIVLVGIDFYESGTDRRDDKGQLIRWSCLKGCVQDVTDVRKYLEETLKVNPLHIMTLTSPRIPCSPSTQLNHDGTTHTEDPENLPTYRNIVRLLKRITKEAIPGDVVHIHYSGHGARVAKPHWGTEGIHNAIVPFDVNCGGKYLGHEKLFSLAKGMVQKQLFVTIVLDCCYSGTGSATRGSTETWDSRGISQIDVTESVRLARGRTALGKPPPAGPHQTFNSRGMKVHFEKRKGYEYLAACQVNQECYESTFDDGLRHGVLTYHLLESLSSAGENVTHGMLHRQVTALVKQYKRDQTPVFEGDSGRYFFNSSRREDQRARTIRVKAIDGNRLTLEAGNAHGISKGSELAIYPWKENDFNDYCRQPKVGVINVFDMESTAEFIEPHPDNENIKPGSQAVLYKSSFQNLSVSFLNPSSRTKIMFDQLKQEIDCSASSSVKLVSDSDGCPAFRIGVENNHYRLFDASVTPINHFPSSKNPKSFLRSLRHLAKYEMIRNLKNLNVSDELKGTFSFELEVDGSAVDPIYCGKEGTRCNFKFRNLSSEAPLFVTIFYFQPSWEISKIFPTQKDCTIVEKGHCAGNDIEFEMVFPDNWNTSWPNPVDYVKAFITSKATSFDILQLSKLDPHDTAPEHGLARGNSDLEDLFEGLGVTNRQLRVVSAVSGHWVTAEIEVRTKRCGTASTPDATDSVGKAEEQPNGATVRN